MSSENANVGLAPASVQQEGVWFHALNTVNYYWNFIQKRCFKGKMDLHALETAMEIVLQRHASLRTHFLLEDDRLYQVIRSKVTAREVLSQVTVDADDQAGWDARVLSEMAAAGKEGFDLQKDVLVRLKVLHNGEMHFFILTMHHIITDSFSMGIFWSELSRWYDLACDRGPVTYSMPEHQYAGYCAAQRSFEASADYKVQKEYWLHRLSGEWPAQAYPFYRDPATAINYHEVALPACLVEDIRSLSLKRKVLYSAVYQLAYFIFLYRWWQQERIAVGNVVDGRGFGKKSYKDVIGLFAKRLVNIQEVRDEDVAGQLLVEVNKGLLESFANSDIAYESLARELNQENRQGLGPVFRAVFNMVKGAGHVVFSGLDECDVTGHEGSLVGDTQYDVGLSVWDSRDRVLLRMDLKCGKEWEPCIEWFLEEYVRILHQCVYEPHLMVKEMGGRSLPEMGKGEDAAYEAEATIISLFREQALRVPDGVAVVFGERRLSYRQLEERSNQVAHYLGKQGVGLETPVCICMERSPELLIGLLGIMKAGGAYVPVDPAYPPGRVQYILSDTGAQVVVDKEMLDRAAVSREAVVAPEVGASAGNLAYVIYTSGSTGRPKGVMIEHRSLVNYVLNCRSYLGDEEGGSGSFSYLPFTFDASITGLFVPLVVGRAVILSRGEGLEVFNDALLKGCAPYDHIKLTPAHLRLLEEATKGWEVFPARRLVIGGEALQAGDLQFLSDRKTGVEIVNEYGPTETTVGCCTYVCRPGEWGLRIPIGRPMNNVRMYILDKGGRPVPVGVAGELYIGGVQVARGYLGRAELTAEKFVADVYGGEGERMYRTGDIGRWLPDGAIEYLGRKDEQLKIRGYRIEPGEIESVVQRSGLVRQVVVVGRQDAMGVMGLVGYVVGEKGFSRKELGAYLQLHLPAYMIPAVWVELEELPLTPTGKVDKRALPEPERAGPEKEYVAPRNELEKQLAAIWQEVLGLERIGVHDSFFELGGHSLTVMKALSLIRRRLDMEPAIRDLFLHVTIDALAGRLREGVTLKDSIKISVEVRPDRLPLSFGQERMWFIHRLEGSVHYHIPWVLRCRGPLNIMALAAACRAIVDRHEVLRTIVAEEGGIGHQQVMEKGRWELEVLRGEAYRDDPGGLELLINDVIDRPYDISAEHMLRMHLVALSNEEHILVINLHHIAADGWSWGILMSELTAAYTAFNSGKPLSLPALPIQYADYALWQRAYLAGAVLDEQLRYWQQQLAGIQPLELPLDHPRPAVQGTRGGSASFTIDPGLVEKLRHLSGSSGATLFMTLLAAFKVLLYRHSGQKDICVGTPVAGRRHQETEGLIGSFINTLALRSDLGGDPSFRQLLQRVRTTTLDAYDHQDVPFEKVVTAMVEGRDLSRPPLFQVMLSLNANEMPALELQGVELSEMLSEGGRVKFDLTVNIIDSGGSMTCHVHYCRDLYEAATIRRMLGHYRQLLESVVVMPDGPIGDMPMLTKAEEDLLLQEFKGRTTEYPRNKTLIHLFGDQVARTPDRMAVICGSRTLSYRALDQRSNQLANYLRKLGVKKETPVAICIERSPEMLTGILGILKAGGAYVPVDPACPSERMAYMLSDTDAPLVLCSRSTSRVIPQGFAGKIFVLDEAVLDSEPVIPPEVLPGPENLAYVLYTSGSTGRPKGVMIEHRNVMTLLYGFQQVAPADGECAGMSVCPFVFDVSVWEFFINLCFGGTLHLLPEEACFDPELLAAYISGHGITTAYIPPTLLTEVADHLNDGDRMPALKRMLVGVLPIRQSVLQRWLDKIPGLCIINGYGPTETTICASFFRFRGASAPGLPVPIGRPVDNYRIYLLDEGGHPVPVGVRGEICIAGDGVGRGYLNKRTDIKFVADPFSSEAESRLYYTGDLAKWLPEGDLMYVGRLDDQIKIRGYRIEPGEIENTALQSGLVKECVVSVRQQEGHSRLVGYVTTDSGFDEGRLRTYLLRQLPEYMVPGHWVHLTAIPVTPSGKVDKQALPEPAAGSDSQSYAEPANELESLLAKIWQQLLGLEQVGMHDNYFSLGGDSIITIQICSRVKREGYTVRPKDIFLHPTIRQLSAMVLARRDAPPMHAEQGILEGSSGLLPIQQWWLSQAPAHPVLSHFNQSVLPGLDKRIGPEELAKAIAILVQRHDALRNVYTRTSSGWLQHFGNKCGEVTFCDLRMATPAELHPEITRRADELQATLNIEKGVLLRVVLFQTPGYEARNYLLVVIHHLAVDGVSWRILLEDLAHLLTLQQQGKPVDLMKTSSCRDWRRALEEYAGSHRLLSQESYWTQLISDTTGLRADHSYSGEMRMSDMGIVDVRLSAHRTSMLLLEAPQTYHTEINELLLAALAQALYGWSGGTKIIVGLEGHGREESIAEGIDLSRTIGWFTSLYPVLLEYTAGESPAQLIKRTKEDLRRTPDKGLGYGVLKYMVRSTAMQGRDPWDIIFNYLGQLDSGSASGDQLQPSALSPGREISEDMPAPCRLSVNSWVSGGELHFQWNYSSRHYHRETIVAVAGAYMARLDELIIHCTSCNNKAVHTPADFGLGAEISYQELDSFLEERAGGGDALEF